MTKTTEGTMNVELKDENGITLTKAHGFTVKEEAGKVLAFDKIESVDYGTSLLFGNQVYFVKFWDDEDVERALTLTREVLEGELERRKNA